jgi:hypothetical protein
MKFLSLLILLFSFRVHAINTASSLVTSSTGGGFPLIYPGNQQVVVYDASVRSAAFGAKASVIRIICTTDCHVAFGTTAAPTTPTAVADGTATFCKANIEYFFGVIPKSKVAVIKDASGGSAYISEGL